MSRRIYTRVERVIIALMVLGMVGMFQPLSVDVYRYGFLTLLLSTILFIIISHLSVKPDPPDAAGAADMEQAANRAQGHNL